MTLPIFNFTGSQANPDQTAQAGLQQYLAQGQQGISPGQAQVMASNPIRGAAAANLAQAFGQPNGIAPPQPPQTQMGQQNAYDVMNMGANLQPNAQGLNTGGVGPTQNNAYALRLANFLQPQMSN